MFSFLIPDFYFHSIHDIDIDFFVQNNIKALLLDIDNTLEPYSTPNPSEKTAELIKKVKDAGISVAIISNNHEDRVRGFCASLDVCYTFESGKPSSKKINEILTKMSVPKENAVIVGDQLFTDIWASTNSGIKGIFVDKINSNESFLIKLKRLLETPFVLHIKKKGYGRIK